MTELNLKNSGTVRISQIILGAIAIVLSLAIIANPGIGVSTLLILLSITLIVAGLERMVSGGHSHLKKSSRVGNIVLGALVIGLGIVVLAFPIITTLLLVTFLAMGLLFLGIARIIQGFANKESSKWSRIGLIAVGVISIAISSVVLAHPVSGIVLLTVLLAINLLIIGADSIVHGATGRGTRVSTSTTTIGR
ncbi:MAG TPA: DUF308 domain-containing protein [Verrucomicrobiae bacterium]|nr:DUF308 domain-containing protein [Verrucomicrobiae bacterium]